MRPFFFLRCAQMESSTSRRLAWRGPVGPEPDVDVREEAAAPVVKVAEYGRSDVRSLGLAECCDENRR